MSVLQKLRAWWNRDALETAVEETRLSQGERDVAQEDYEARKDDDVVREHLPGGVADYESDSERPRP